MATTYLNSQTQIGNFEDRIDDFVNISPKDTPVLSKMGKSVAENTTHYWQTESLNTANKDNAVVDGADSTYASTDYKARAQLLNYTQIMRRMVQVSFTQDAIRKPKLGKGKLSEFDHQKGNRTIELNLDAEAAIVSANTKTAPAPESGTAGKFDGIQTLITTNAIDATDAAYGNTKLSQPMFEDLAQKCWSNGGTPRNVFCGIYSKRKIAGFVQQPSRLVSDQGKKLVNVVDSYESVAGLQEIELERNLEPTGSTGTLLMLQVEYWKIAWLRAPQFYMDGANGSKTKGFVEFEATLEALAQNSSGKITNLAIG